MALVILDATGVQRTVKTTPDGSGHHVHHHHVDSLPEVAQATHDDLNLNANLQIGDADVGAGNKVPAKSDSYGDFLADVNLQVGDADVDADNPVPATDAGYAHTVTRTRVTSADASSGVTLLAAAGSGNKNRIIDLDIQAAGGCGWVEVKESGGANLTPRWLVDATDPFQWSRTYRATLAQPTADTIIQVWTGAAGNIDVMVRSDVTT